MNRRVDLDDHLARILLVLSRAQSDGRRPDVLTILFMDFLVRYPVLLEQVATTAQVASASEVAPNADEISAISASAVRFKLNSDQTRYRVLIGALVGMRLLEVDGQHFLVTAQGAGVVAALSSSETWSTAVRRVQIVVQLLSATDDLPSLVYACLPDRFIQRLEL